ncbi:unnamed protein product [Parnassius mnemosyne]|uniref:ETFB lysine methyltransferase n=1 Tax=Parnassius mnemosyne TaxID=213953 RepID=A0AAV1L3L5_9NEOP
MLKNLTAQILRHTAPSRQHLTPEIALRLITPSCPLWSAPVEDSPFKDPFWAFYWPGGQATARYILDNKQVVKNRVVLDVGCGCGAGSIAAAFMEAKRVVANDIDEVAVIASLINAEFNGIKIETNTEDMIGRRCEEFEVVLIGDMFYDEEFAKVLFEWLKALTENGKTVLIGDPGRHGLTHSRREHLSLLATYQLPKETCLENHGYTETTLWRLNSV